MPDVIDPEMERVARQRWAGPLRLVPASGGLFNRVLRVESSGGIAYLKRFTDTASSGDFPPLPTSARDRCLVASRWHETALRAAARVPGVSVPSLLALQDARDMVAMDRAPGEPLYDALVDGVPPPQVLEAVIDWMGALHALPLEPRGPLLAASAPFKAFKVDLQYTRLLPEMAEALHAPARRFIAGYLAADAECVHGDLNSRNVLVSDGRAAVIDFEQGHFGEGSYDLAYLLSEYVVRELRFARDPAGLLDATWARYRTARGGAGAASPMRAGGSTPPSRRCTGWSARAAGPGAATWTSRHASGCGPGAWANSLSGCGECARGRRGALRRPRAACLRGWHLPQPRFAVLQSREDGVHHALGEARR